MASFSTKIKIEDVCRTCLVKEDVLLSIFDVCYDTITLDSIISTITGVKIEQGDGLPSTVCRNCEEKAANAFDFKKRSQEADVTLRNLFKKEQKELEDSYTYQNKDGVKTEQCAADDQHDYVEWNGFEDLNDMENVKNETDFQTQMKCKNCNTNFQSLEKLQEHLRVRCLKVEVDDANSNYCPVCDTGYFDATSLTKHMWDTHRELMGPKKRGRPKKLITSTIVSILSENGFHIKSVPNKKLNCMFCAEEFKTKEETRIHQTEHKDIKLLYCLLCKKYYLEKKYFDLHNCTEHKDNENKIREADAKSKTEQNSLSETTLQELLDANCDTKNNFLIQVCRVCSGVFASEEDIANHIDIEHPELSLRCNLCNKIFASVKSANRHRSMCKQIERKHRCNTCGLQFAYEISLNKHILRYHEGESVSVKFMDSKQEYKCDNCTKIFYRKDLLIKHTRVHSGKYFECDICKKKFNRSDNLRSHKRTHEPREKTKLNSCLCLYCGRSFNNSSNLIVHMRRHTGEKPYKCDFCGKGFPRSSDLQCHRRSHTGEKPCVCGVCGKGFSRSNKLSRHMRVHTGIKPYKCTYCEKAFSQSNDLTLHIRRHTGDKPYICEICGDRFIQGTALHNHRRSHGHFPPSSSDIQIQGITYTVQNINHQELNQ